MIQPSEKYVVLDIESNTVGEKPNSDVDELRYVGFKNYQGKKVVYHYTQHDEIQKVLDYFPYIVGHNILLFDIPILERHGFEIPYKTIVIDTFKISMNRLKQMLYLDLNEGDRSLRALCDRFDLSHKKGEFDYSLLKKDKLEGEELEKLIEYSYSDLDSADDLFKYYYDLFYGFREYVSDRDKERMSWLVSRSGTTCYKVICNLIGLPEEYNNDYESSSDETYSGGFVLEPHLDFVGE